MTDYERLIVQKSGGIGWLILNRPEAGNAFDALMLDELEHAWADLEADPDVRVIVNTANGRRSAPAWTSYRWRATGTPCASTPGGPGTPS
ncbi:enoyl-CoA hydratase/isomerase family protein [Mycolicibacter hiberniae]|uniref:enoyl-CoA hydratase/isomerase family protein n=1 Tax=Mycolicibacter hiberniae TaxID=29314 RepID=UPI001F23CAE7|nr:enoyl-CoA hydratase-related protein [Mycolicibacter hiberniae]